MLGSTGGIQTKYVFGFKADVSGAISHVDEHKVIYAAGNYVVTYNTEDKLMQFYSGSETTLGITCLALSPLRRYLAVAEKGDPATVRIFDTQNQRKKKDLISEDVAVREYVAISFAPGQENKFLITLSGAPDWSLIYWQWERPRALFIIPVSSGNPVAQLSFNSNDHNHGIVALGLDLFRWYKLTDGRLKVQCSDVHRKDPSVSSNYLSHCWLSDNRLVVGNEQGQLMLLDQNCEYKTHTQLDKPGAVRCLVTSLAGFFAGSDSGNVFRYEFITENTLHCSRVISLSFSPAASVVALSLPPNIEEDLVVALSNSQLYSVNLANEREAPTPLSNNFHNGPITGLDICIRKPLIVTCGQDKWVRIWNYQERKLEVEHIFPEDPLSVAFHPSGFHIVVGFADKLRMLNVFSKSIKAYKELPIKACREVRFSHGGHMFAAANGNVIHVYNFYTADNPPHMIYKGHPNRVKAISWADDDTGFVSASLDGAIYEWKLYAKGEQAHAQEYFEKKGVNFNSVVVIPDARAGEGRAIYTVGSDKMLKEILESTMSRAIETGMVLSAITLSHSGKLLFAGVGEPDHAGAVRVYNFSPLTGDFVHYAAHSGPVERLCVSYDDCHLFSVGADGCLIIFEIKDRDIRALKREREALGLPPAEEVLITKPDVEELHQQIENLITINRDLESSSKMHSDLILQEKQETIDKLKEELINESQQYKNRIDSLSESKKELEQQYEDRIRTLREQNEIEMQELETTFQQKIMVEVGRYQELVRERESDSTRTADKIEGLMAQHKAMYKEKSQEYSEQLEEEQVEINRLRKEKEDQERRYNEITRQLESDNDREIDSLREQNNREMQQIKDQSLQANGQLSLVQKKQTVLQGDISKLTDEIKEHQLTINQHEKTIEELKTEKDALKEKTGKRDTKIGDKEREIYELKKTNQELEKFKFVLDFKIRELKRDIVPREEEIALMKEQTSDMDKDLKAANAHNEYQGKLVENLHKQQKRMKQRIEHNRGLIRVAKTRLKEIKNCIYDCAQVIQDKTALKDSVLHLYNAFVRDEARPKEVDTEINKEYEQQHNYLRKNVKSLNAKVKLVSSVHKEENIRIMKENQDLIKEINQLRTENKAMNYVKRQFELLTQRPKNRIASQESQAILEMQREQIADLQAQIREAEAAQEAS